MTKDLEKGDEVTDDLLRECGYTITSEVGQITYWYARGRWLLVKNNIIKEVLNGGY